MATTLFVVRPGTHQIWISAMVVLLFFIILFIFSLICGWLTYIDPENANNINDMKKSTDGPNRANVLRMHMVVSTLFSWKCIRRQLKPRKNKCVCVCGNERNEHNEERKWNTTKRNRFSYIYLSMCYVCMVCYCYTEHLRSESEEKNDDSKEKAHEIPTPPLAEIYYGCD